MKTLAIFFLNVIQNTIGMAFGLLFRRKANRNSFRALSDIEKVKYLEKRRQYKGYKKKWLYHKCKEEGLLNTYNKLFQPELVEEDSGTKFRFGNLIGNISIGYLNKNG